MIAIYKSESFLIEDKVKEYFNRLYRHIDLRIMMDETNDLVNGYLITLTESKLMIGNSHYVSFKDIESYKDAIDKIMFDIDDLLRNMLYKYYTI